MSDRTKRKPEGPDPFAEPRETFDLSQPGAGERFRRAIEEYNRTVADLRGNLAARESAAATALRALGYAEPPDVQAAALRGEKPNRKAWDAYRAWLHVRALRQQVDALGAAATPEVERALVFALGVGEDCFRAFARKVEDAAAAGIRAQEHQKKRNALRWGSKDERTREDAAMLERRNQITAGGRLSREAAYKIIGGERKLSASAVKTRILEHCKNLD